MLSSSSIADAASLIATAAFITRFTIIGFIFNFIYVVSSVVIGKVIAGIITIILLVMRFGYVADAEVLPVI